MPETRYDYGGDEYILVVFNEAMDLATNFTILAVCQEIKRQHVPGVIEACPANASYLVHFRPEEVHPDQLIRMLKEIEQAVQHAGTLRSRLVDIPVLFDDPWTRECAQRFGDRHQDPSVSNLEYLMRINGYSAKEEFITAYCDTPYWVSMVGFVPGTAWCYRMVPPERAIQAPKYIRPRTDTPERAVAHGGVFLCIYPVRGPGGYQMIGMSAVPVYDPEEHLPDLRGRYILAEAGDRWKFRPIDKGPTFRFKAGQQPFDAGADPSNVVDLGYPVGSIQIPGGLEAILLLNDAVTGGGYTTIGTVIKVDLDRVAQVSPGSKIRFRAVGIEEALQARRAREARLARVRLTLGIFDQAGELGQ